MRCLTALILLCAPAFGQYSEFAASDDGQQVYFTTLLAEPATSPQSPPELRIFRIDGKAVQLVAERGLLARTDVGGTGDGASSLQLSGDGQSVAFILSNICPPPGPCRSIMRRAEIRGRGATVLGEADRIHLSKNGKWALLVPPRFSSSPLPGESPQPATETILLNLETGAKTPVGTPATSDGAFVLASDGSVFQRAATTSGPTLGIWKDGVLKPLPPLTGAFALLGMSDDAGTVLVSRIMLPQPGQPPGSLPVPDLLALDLLTGTSKLLHTLDSPGRYLLLGMSNDGRRALLRTTSASGPGPMILANMESGDATSFIISEEEWAVSGTLSGSGNAAIVGTNRGRILRFAWDDPAGISAPPEELLPAIPYIDFIGFLAPGALFTTPRPLSGDIDWNGRIQATGLPFAVIRESARDLTLQVPWNLQVGFKPLTIDYPSESPLVQRSQLFIAQQAPHLVPPPPGAGGILGGILIKEDSSGPITTAPKTGEIVHIFMTGLGAVRGSMKTGEPTPIGDPRPLNGYVHCAFPPNTTDTETVFAGLVPGMIGIYQLTLRFPADTPDTPPNGIRCGFNTSTYNFVFQSLGTP